MAAAPHPILLYDGDCRLCSRLVLFVLRKDVGDVFRFASLQSGLAGDILKRQGIASGLLNTVYLVLDFEQPNEHLLCRSDALIYVLEQFGGSSLRLARVLRRLPKFLRNFAYLVIARTRYRLFGKNKSCPLPEPHLRNKFLDL